MLAICSSFHFIYHSSFRSFRSLYFRSPLPSSLFIYSLYFFIFLYFLFLGLFLPFYHLCHLEKLEREVLRTHLEHGYKLCASHSMFGSLAIGMRYDASAQELLTEIKTRWCWKIKTVTLIHFDTRVNSNQFLQPSTRMLKRR
jgi:hypothetical protein